MYVVFILACTVLASVGQACSPIEGWYPPTVTERVLRSEIVLYGKIIANYPDKYQSSAYTAEMEVYCTLKGRQTDPVVNLTEAGFVPGLCHGSKLLPGNVYIVLLGNDNDDRIRVSDAEINVTETDIADVKKACGLRPVYPKGVDPTSVSSDRSCITALPSSSDCLNLDHFKRTPNLPEMISTTSKTNDNVYYNAYDIGNAESIRNTQSNNNVQGTDSLEKEDEHEIHVNDGQEKLAIKTCLIFVSILNTIATCFQS